MTDCIGCRPTKPIFPTNAMKFEQYFYFSSSDMLATVKYLTPLRAYDLCRADMEGAL